MPDHQPPVRLDRVLEDPGLVRRLVERNGPYFPVQRYFTNDAQYRANTGAAQTLIAPVFRGDWAYDTPQIEGVEPLLFHEGFQQAARDVFGAKIVRPQQVYSNLTWQLPFPQGPGHTDIPAFRGIDRTRYPTQFLSLMGHSRLFEKYRVRIATAVAWFYQGEDGGFEYWPEGPDQPSTVHEGEIFNSAIVGDNDFMYHRARSVGALDDGLPQGMSLQTRLEHVADDAWRIVEGDREFATMGYESLRISVSWKANVFADERDERLYLEHVDDLAIEDVWSALFADLEARGEAFTRPADPLNDLELTELLGRVYVHAPSA